MDKKILTQKVLDCFNQHLIENERSNVTIEKYNRDIKKLIVFLDGREVTKELVIAYKKYLIDNRYSENSTNSMLASINSLFVFLGWNDCRIKLLKLQKQIFCREEKELTKDEYYRLCNIAKKKQNDRLFVVLQTIGSTGIRISELKYITVEAAKAGKTTVHCKGKIRTIFIINRLQKLLLDYAKKHCISNGCIFITRSGKPVNRTNIWREMKSLCKEANVNPSKVFPHNLRHLFARMFWKIEKDIAKLADILGHSSINTTRIYIISAGNEHRQRLEQMKMVC